MGKVSGQWPACPWGWGSREMRRVSSTRGGGPMGAPGFKAASARVRAEGQGRGRGGRA